MELTLGIELESVERSFQEAYARLRGERSTDVPLLLVVGDELVLRRGAARESFELVPPSFRVVKAASHLAVASFLSLSSKEDVRSRVALRDMSSRALEAVRRGPENSLHEPLVATLYATHAALEKAIAAAAPGADHAAAASFVREVRDPLSVLLAAAAELQLESIHRSAEAAVAKLSPEELETVRVVVAGNHQARRRSLPMQYFQRRAREREGEEPRVVYGENVTTEEEALALLGTLRADRVLARAFFGDPSRMDRDLLGDVAERRLDALKLVPFGAR